MPLHRYFVFGREAGCDTGTVCSPVIPTPQLADGSYKGWVRTKNAIGWGPLSDIVRFSVGSVPGKAILDTPTGTLPTFSWNAVTGASDYRLWVRDNVTNATLIDTLYSAAEAGCDTGTVCSPVLPTPQLADGRYKGWVRTKNAIGWGPFSDVLRFNVPTPP